MSTVQRSEFTIYQLLKAGLFGCLVYEMALPSYLERDVAPW